MRNMHIHECTPQRSGAPPTPGLRLAMRPCSQITLGRLVYIHTYTFFGEQPTGQTLRPILTRGDSKYAKSRKDVPFGVTKIKDDIKPLC